jgi:hypothetical protein
MRPCCQPPRHAMQHAKGGLAYRKRIHQEHRRVEVGAARSATELCSALPRIGRRVGADPISLGHVSVQTIERYLDCKQRFDQPSMIALASSRILELGARLRKGSRPYTRDHSRRERYFCQTTGSRPACGRVRHVPRHPRSRRAEHARSRCAMCRGLRCSSLVGTRQ